MSEPCRNLNNLQLAAGENTMIGVLAVQGDFLEHINMLSRIGADSKEIRLPEQLDGLDGLIIPGGESTTIVQLIDIYGFRDCLIESVSNGLAVWGTCAGMIAIAKSLTDSRPKPLGLMDIEVTRNAFGRQVDSFETYLNIAEIGNPDLHAVFIRAPKVIKAGTQVQVLARSEDGSPVAVREKRMLATSFHPELTDDTRLHKLFLDMSLS